MAFEYTIIREFNKEKERAREEGEKKGREIGRDEGEEKYLIKLVCQKLQKGKALEVIAEELEEDPEKIRAIFEKAVNFAPDYDWEKVFAVWWEYRMVMHKIY